MRNLASSRAIYLTPKTQLEDTMATHVTFNMLTDLSSLNHLATPLRRIVAAERIATYQRAATTVASYMNAMSDTARLSDDILILIFTCYETSRDVEVCHQRGFSSPRSILGSV